ncbi:MAG: hypothetical protein E7279_03420 [Lachnospiraceae bacterium]|nr:hypothetical protein [Lachnospiraceae bacterium]
MTALIESVDFVRKIINTYGNEFKGFYLAIIITLAVIAICNLKNKAIRSYIIYCIIILISLLVLAFLDYAFEFLPEDDAGEIFNVLPVLVLILLGFAILLPFLVRKPSDKKKKIWCAGIVIGVTLVFLVEASVPVQWTFRNFTISRAANKYPSDIVEIADTVGTHSVLLPEDYKIRVKTYNRDANIISNSSSFYDYRLEDVFKFSNVSKIDYIVIKKKDYFGTTNVDSLNAAAKSYKYTLVKDLGEYMIYGSSSVV